MVETQKDQEETKDIIEAETCDYDCPICYQLCVQPVVTPCNHFFCFKCEKEILKKGMCCPLCRSKFPRSFAPVVDRSMQKTIEEEMGEDFKKRKMELIKSKDWVGSKKLIRFSYGNTYERLDGSMPAFPEDSSCNLKLHHSWAMFVILTEDRTKTEGYIKSVTYHIPQIDKEKGLPNYESKR